MAQEAVKIRAGDLMGRAGQVVYAVRECREQPVRPLGMHPVAQLMQRAAEQDFPVKQRVRPPQPQ